MAKFGAIYLSIDVTKNSIEEVENVAAILVKQGYLFTVRYHQDSPWIQLYIDEPENVISYAKQVARIFPNKQTLGLAAYTVSDSVSFCYFQGENIIRLLQSGFSQERQWEIIEGEKQAWEDELFSKLTLEIGKIGMVSYHIQQIGVLLNLPGFGIPRQGEPWTKEVTQE
ncbi:hypothetical protein WH8501_03220 [Crocosphaera watsonii WH 8501]|uniref:Uncharacterized protein n=5 Tax=Crocosphaera watsonii TaxID=263511 RepID=Q4BXW2_CROWT|nr:MULTISPECIES: hypothetical protein [Crocosphaera]EAM48747.1 hypothetical protein CwatDRAFT_1374 [Crocosphaera watsonii WH 8501]EHJ10523.1 hypothetical protein CWATWH0003_4734 [Crocosphaera watsonii WH 0003]MCH2246229.1 hypothetical protein [Crocosphaera sp.]NQZ61724.1 hypothetical protein [Crocosphaera sp.]CCQ55451.1 hypothetical protein CWATWH0005_3676 [Crocosphaera watsonii WH 0005]